MATLGLRPTATAVGMAKFVLIGLPAYYYAASFLQQQAFESTFQFGSFGREDDTAETLLSKYFGKDDIQKINDVVK